ncbi:hypothetical protein SDC9_197932 [bioreactor metagenome]|uniref:Microcin J25-processing protein McjB C-terminal domain-containing protein n=1 Tax=bioreactor metagenome TaxID=1076179 RepID=A0A645IH44_9ZZZZ|nr:lasso peptide biosynthesis B2 protein [Rikenellaceae bacterium]
MSNIKAYARLTKRERLLFWEALFFLFSSKLLLMLPFRYCIKLLKRERPGAVQLPPEELRRIRDAISRANKLAFWKNICIVKSFAARFMLQRRKIDSEMFYGLRVGEGKLEAHAWLVAGDVTITPKGNQDMKVIYKV